MYGREQFKRAIIDFFNTTTVPNHTIRRERDWDRLSLCNTSTTKWLTYGNWLVDIGISLHVFIRLPRQLGTQLPWGEGSTHSTNLPYTKRIWQSRKQNSRRQHNTSPRSHGVSAYRHIIVGYECLRVTAYGLCNRRCISYVTETAQGDGNDSVTIKGIVLFGCENTIVSINILYWLTRPQDFLVVFLLSQTGLMLPKVLSVLTPAIMHILTLFMLHQPVCVPLIMG